MHTCVVVLRGINVGGHKRVKMSELSACLEQAGAHDVQTYVQSGNVILDWETRADTQVERTLHDAIEQTFGYDVSVMARGANEWLELIASNPYADEAEAEGKSVHMICLGAEVQANISLERFDRACTQGERYALIGQALYVHYPQGAGRSKLAHALMERVLGVSCTARNWRTVMACARICAARKQKTGGE